MTLLLVDDLGVMLGGRLVVEGASLRVDAGECVGLIGPNGAGKSTLLRAALGLQRHSGRSSLAALPAAERALAAAWLPQSREIAWDVTVESIVALGRIAHRRPGAPAREADRHAIAVAMAETDVAQFAEHPARRLSGGEQARVLLARALAQEAPLLIADEPTASLDPAHQIGCMESFERLRRAGRSVVVALHDLGLAARWCTRLVLMEAGRILCDGSPDDVLSAERLRSVYGVDAVIERRDGRMLVQPLALAPNAAP
ncbi:MAG: ABC transporter ATP-binding protein [Pseudomonadota bacterium]